MDKFNFNSIGLFLQKIHSSFSEFKFFSKNSSFICLPSRGPVISSYLVACYLSVESTDRQSPTFHRNLPFDLENHPLLVRSSGSIWFDFNKPRPTWWSPANQRRVREPFYFHEYFPLSQPLNRIIFRRKKGKAKSGRSAILRSNLKKKKMAPEVSGSVVKQINIVEIFFPQK